VSEIVAYQNAITPSELADFLIQKFHQFAVPVDEAQNRIIQASKSLFEREEHLLMQFSQSISWNSKTMLANQEHRLTVLMNHMQLFCRQLLKDRKADLNSIQRLLQLADPKQLLKKGFSITKIKDRKSTRL